MAKKDDLSKGAGKGKGKNRSEDAGTARPTDREAEAARMRARLAELEREAESERVRARLAELKREAEEDKAREAAEAAVRERAKQDEASETERMRARLAALEREAEETKARKAAEAAAETARAEAAAAARQESEAETMRARLAQLEREAAAAKAASASAAVVAAPASAASTGPVAQWQEPPRKGRKGLVALVAVEAVAVVAASALLVATLVGVPVPGLSSGTGAAAAIGAGPEVQLAQASTVGDAPFNDVPFGNMPDTAVATADTQKTPTAGTALNATAVPGDTEFIYGRPTGATAETLCNRDGMAAYFDGDAAAATAFVEALSADPEAAEAAGGSLGVADLGDYVLNTFRATLVADTFVTLNARTEDGTEAVPTVLQKGTEVLVDKRGVPRIKCFGANPLTAAPELSGAPTYSGTAWAGFDPDIIAVITAASADVPKLDIRTPATADGTIGFLRAPGPDFVAPTTVACEADGFDAATQAASMTVTNSSAETVWVAVQDPQSYDCTVNLQWILYPGQSFSYPFPGETYVPYPGIVLIATTSATDGVAVWSSSVTSGQTAADITF